MKNAALVLNRVVLGLAFVVGGSSLAIAAEHPMPAENAADMDSEQPVTDTWITTKVKADLATTEGVKSTDISVTTVNGVVTLIGVLDSKTGVEIMELFEQLYEQGNTIIVVTHEEDIARHARRIVRLRDGLIESDEQIT